MDSTSSLGYLKRQLEAQLGESMGMIGADGRPSIFELVTAAAAARGDAREELRVEIPNDKPDNQIRFAPGAFDAVFGATDDSDLQVDARTIVAAFSNAVRQPSSAAYAALYRKLTEISTISVVDEVLERIPQELQDANREATAALARRIIREAADVEPIKMAVAILAISGEPGKDEDLIREIGQFEEITLFSLVGFTNLLPEPEDAIFRLAQHVHGWGRIHAVERLADTADPRIRRWVLREGFRNAIMYEYLAYIAATTGGLHAALGEPEIEDELLLAAAEILAALISGGPARGIEDYADGAAACITFLEHAAKRDVPSLPVISAVIDIRNFSQSENAQKLREAGWSARVVMGVRTVAAAFLQKPGARLAVEAGLTSEEKWGDFFIAAAAAPAFGIDPWPFQFARQERRIGEQWYFLMQTSDAARIDQVLALARQQLDFAKVGSGPTDSLALGPDYEDDSALDFILQDLRRFPGQGWDLIKVGLRARGVRARNMAVNALRDWGRDAWPDDAEAEFGAAVKRETDDEIRDRLSDLIAGRLKD